MCIMSEPLPFHITIARQLGSGGSELGQRLACRLGFAYLDHQILQQAAKELGMSEAELAHREERIQSFWVRMVEAFSTGCPEYMMSTPPPKIISDERLVEAEQQVLLRLSAQGSCVIVGRCGFHLLARRARLLNIFIHAPSRFRIERMTRLFGAANETVASEMMESTDRDRERYVERFTGQSWYDARHYHLAIDMSQVGFDTAEEMIVSLANRICGQSVS
jgi:cytidylate kinase